MRSVAVVVATLTLFAGGLALVSGGTGRLWVGATSGDKPVAAVAATDDFWRAPRLPSHPGTHGRAARGLVSIAVMPFAVHGEGGERSQTIADVMTDDLTNILSRVPGFRVISRQTAQTIPYKNLPEADYAAALASFGVPEGFAQAIAGWDVAVAQGAVFDDNRQLSALIGRPTTPLSTTVADALKSVA